MVLKLTMGLDTCTIIHGIGKWGTICSILYVFDGVCDSFIALRQSTTILTSSIALHRTLRRLMFVPRISCCHSSMELKLVWTTWVISSVISLT